MFICQGSLSARLLFPIWSCFFACYATNINQKLYLEYGFEYFPDLDPGRFQQEAGVFVL